MNENYKTIKKKLLNWESSFKEHNAFNASIFASEINFSRNHWKAHA